MFKKHEFSVTPRSLFAPDGRPWKCLIKRKHHSHDEADTLIICLVCEIARLNQSNTDFSVKILSPDTDVLILAITSAVCYPTCRIIFKLLSRKNRRELDVDAIVKKLRRQKANLAFLAHMSALDVIKLVSSTALPKH